MPPTDAAPVALITGASRGLGAALAHKLAADGWRLILVARTPGALEAVDDDIRAAGHPGATLVPIDLGAKETIERMGLAVIERFGRLDHLYGLAATLGPLTPTAQLDIAQWDRTMAINATANLRLLQVFDPLLRASPQGRAVFTTCEIAENPKGYWAGYGASKAALSQIVLSYRQEIQHTAMAVDLIDPGPMATRLRARAFPGEDAGAVRTPEEAVATVMGE